MSNVLYNCHTDGLSHRITKFIDGNPEASYLVSRDACECPAGHRASCRHRQMLPEFLNRNLVDSHLFIAWDLPSQPTCDFEGNEAVPEELHDREDTPVLTGLQEEQILMGFHQPELCKPVPHSVAASTEAFDASSTGSNPVGATKPTNWRRL